MPKGFGSKHGRMVTGTENHYTYNGKELNSDFDLDWLDYGARWYDASIARWSAVDPLAEKYIPYTPYNYVLNNPIMLIDPDGREVGRLYNPSNSALDLFAITAENSNNPTLAGRGATEASAGYSNHDFNPIADAYEQNLDDESTRYAVVTHRIYLSSKGRNSRLEAQLGYYEINYVWEYQGNHTYKPISEFPEKYDPKWWGYSVNKITSEEYILSVPSVQEMVYSDKSPTGFFENIISFSLMSHGTAESITIQGGIDAISGGIGSEITKIPPVPNDFYNLMVTSHKYEEKNPFPHIPNASWVEPFKEFKTTKLRASDVDDSGLVREFKTRNRQHYIPKTLYTRLKTTVTYTNVFPRPTRR